MSDKILEVLKTDAGLFALYPAFTTDDGGGGGGEGPRLVDATRVEFIVTQGPNSCLLRGNLGNTDIAIGGDPAYSLSANASTAEALFKNK